MRTHFHNFLNSSKLLTFILELSQIIHKLHILLRRAQMNRSFFTLLISRSLLNLHLILLLSLLWLIIQLLFFSDSCWFILLSWKYWLLQNRPIFKLTRLELVWRSDLEPGGSTSRCWRRCWSLTFHFTCFWQEWAFNPAYFASSPRRCHHNHTRVKRFGLIRWERT